MKIEKLLNIIESEEIKITNRFRASFKDIEKFLTNISKKHLDNKYKVDSNMDDAEWAFSVGPIDVFFNKFDGEGGVEIERGYKGTEMMKELKQFFK